MSRLVKANQVVGDLDDRVSTAIIVNKLDNFTARPIVLETQNVFNLRTSPTVNRLIVIADYAKVSVVLGERFHDSVLAAVGVLVLVDQKVVKATGFFATYLLEVREQLLGQQEQVIKVDDAQRFKLALVFAIGDRGQQLPISVRFQAGFVRSNRIGLPATDRIQQLIRGQ